MADKYQEEALLAQILAIREARRSEMRRTDLPPSERMDRFMILSDELFTREAELFGRLADVNLLDRKVGKPHWQ
ncbi:MAG TPA: hypothetical protein VL175_01710 [Pirellulales bacterium]|jgi:hypothetical protein|nr:hypothetical protein [Pirellulales bacterium]